MMHCTQESMCVKHVCQQTYNVFDHQGTLQRARLHLLARYRFVMIHLMQYVCMLCISLRSIVPLTLVVTLLYLAINGS